MKKAAAIIIMLALVLSGICAAATEDIKVVVNGSRVNFADTEPFIENGRTLVPMRAIFEALGAEVVWNTWTRSTDTYDPMTNTSIVITADSDVMLVNGEEVQLDVPAKIVNGRTVVPVRAVAEGMTAKVEWDAQTSTVNITKMQAATTEDLTDETNIVAKYTELDRFNAEFGGAYGMPPIEYLGLEPVKLNINKAQGIAEAVYAFTEAPEITVRVRLAKTVSDISGIYGARRYDNANVYTGRVIEFVMERYITESGTVYGLFSLRDAEAMPWMYSVEVSSDKLSLDEKLDTIRRVAKAIKRRQPVYNFHYMYNCITLDELNREALDGIFTFPDIESDQLKAISFHANTASQGWFTIVGNYYYPVDPDAELTVSFSYGSESTVFPAGVLIDTVPVAEGIDMKLYNPNQNIVEGKLLLSGSAPIVVSINLDSEMVERTVAIDLIKDTAARIVSRWQGS